MLKLFKQMLKKMFGNKPNQPLQKTNNSSPELSNALQKLKQQVELIEREEFYEARNIAENITPIFKKYERWKEYAECLIKWGESFWKAGLIEYGYEKTQEAQKIIEDDQKFTASYKEKLGDEYLILKAQCYNNLASKHYSNQDISECEEWIEESVKILSKFEDKSNPNYVPLLQNLAVTHYKTYSYTRDEKHLIEANKNFKKVQKTVEKLGLKHKLADCLANWGLCESECLQNHKKAIEKLEEALEIYKKLENECELDIARCYSNLGMAYGWLGMQKPKKGYLKKSFENNEKALNGYLKTQNNVEISRVYQNKASIHFFLDEFQKAFKHIQHALHHIFTNSNLTCIDINPKLHISNCLSPTNLLQTIGTKSHFLYGYYHKNPTETKHLIIAYNTIHLATELISELRKSYRKEGSKLMLAARTHSFYDLAINIALSVDEALQNNRDAIMSSYEELRKANQNYNKIPSPEKAKNLAFTYSEQARAILLAEYLKDVNAKKIANIDDKDIEKEKELRLQLAKLEQDKREVKDKNQRREYQGQFFKKNRAYDEHIKKIEEKYPKYYKLKFDHSFANIKDIQQSLNDTQALIEYFVGEQFIYIFVITAHKYKCHRVEKETPNLVKDYLTSLKRLPIRSSRKKYLKTAHELYNNLFKPINKHLDSSGIKHVIIIPDNQLLTIPFEALLTTHTTPEDKISYAKLSYLILKYNISYHYSATLWQESVNIQISTRGQINGLSAFAPVYEDVQKIEDNENTFEFNKHKYDVIIHSKEEAKSVSNTFSKNNLQSECFLNKQAHIDNFRQKTKNYKYILISAHTTEDKPIGIIFSPASNIVTKSDVLNITDIYNLYFSSTDLIVLSCCNTGVGKNYQGEGIIALNRSFSYAGVKNVIYTLFKVDEKKSCELIISFFNYVLEGDSYTTALNKAKKELITTETTPKYWAGMVLIGQ